MLYGSPLRLLVTRPDRESLGARLTYVEQDQVGL
jgi:hypothetical protein